MKEFLGRFLKSKWLWLVLIIIIQTVVYLLAGNSKAYFHMDEIYSYGLANYDRVQLYEAEDFYDTWHKSEWYDDYLTVSEDERWDLAPVYLNQKNDVHPPLFYLLLRLGMELTPGEFSKWTGIVLNTVIAAACTVLLFLIIERLLRAEKHAKVKALLLTLVVALSLMTISTVVYIRMYKLLTMWILLTTYLHLKLLESKKVQPRLLVAIGATAFLGVITQYYYIFFILALFIYFSIKYIRAKQIREWRAYFVSLAIAGLASLVIWPFTVVHLFFSNRGQGVLEYITQPLKLLDNLWSYLGVIDKYVFHKLLLLVILGLLFLGGWALIKGKTLKVGHEQQSTVGMILTATLFYLFVVAAVSPFIELRYIAPVCGLALVVILYCLYRLFELFWRPKTCNIVMGAVLILYSVIMPVVAQIEPDTVYRERAEIVSKIRELSDTPALYVFQSGNDWVFLNDILLFREIRESFLAKDVGADTEKIREILHGKDYITTGLLVFINDEQDDEEILEAVQKATGLRYIEHLGRVVTSDTYYLSSGPRVKTVDK